MRVRMLWWGGLILLAVTGCDVDLGLGAIDLSNPDEGCCYMPGPVPVLPQWMVFIDVRDSADAPADLPPGHLYCVRDGFDTTVAVAGRDTSIAPWSCPSPFAEWDVVTIRVQGAAAWVDSSYPLEKTWQDSLAPLASVRRVTLRLAAARDTASLRQHRGSGPPT